MVVLLRWVRGWVRAAPDGRRRGARPGWGRVDGSEGESEPEAGDRDGEVLVDEVVVDGDGGCRALAGGGDDLGAWVDGVAGGPDAGDAGAPGGVDGDPAVVVGGAAEVGRATCRRGRTGADEDRGAGTTWPVASSTPVSRSSSTTRRATGPSTTPMARAASCSLLVRRERGAVGEEDDVVGPLADQVGVCDRLGRAAAARRVAGRAPRGRGSRGSAAGRAPSVHGCRAGRGCSSRSPVVTRTRRVRRAEPSSRVTVERPLAGWAGRRVRR